MRVDGNIERGVKPGWFIVKVNKVYAPYTKIKNLKVKGERKYVTLGDMGCVPFTIPVPYSMLRKHVDNRKQLVETNKDKTISARKIITTVASSSNTIQQIPACIVLQDNDSIIGEVETVNERSTENNPIHIDMEIQQPESIAEIEQCNDCALKKIMFPESKWITKPNVNLPAPP